MVDTPSDCKGWASGKVSLAAIIYLRSLESAENGQSISAILPDVLRSGSRYKRWRDEVQKLLSPTSFSIAGKFSDHADVDVFTLSGTKQEANNASIGWLGGQEPASATLDQVATVRVGSVVVHRLDGTGKLVPLLNTSKAPPWGAIKQIRGKIHFGGTTVRGPLVVVRRTSSPSDNTRAIATLVDSNQEFAVDNHLITILPLDKKLATCRKIVKMLSDSRTQNWFNTRIRCRHLTVGSLKEIPLLEK
ncbi:MAG: hypothetical protein EOP84_11525 [Verrucomicrobiaceae bacterium]|nr:MAG: hypothetical protein EOP84_11525 [Verrucomicrobiaceae bacterium]